MTDLLDYADKVWRGEADTRVYHTGTLRKDGLHELAEGVWMWPAFGNVFLFPTADGLFCFDTGERRTAKDLFGATRARTDAPLHTAVYSHGHIDHVFGVGPFDLEAEERGWRRPSVLAHENTPPRFERYERTRGYNTVINQRQFQSPGFRWPDRYRHPDVTYRDTTTLRIGDLDVRLKHARGETDDATIAWLPGRKILCCGDFFIWSSPNPGNPQKVQRYAAEWARALRWMAGLGAELLLPGHGVPIAGADRIRTALSDTAEFLETLHDQTVDAMNAGATLDEVVHGVTAPAELLAKPYLKPSYDEPEFVVRNVWRLYGGWYDGNPANLKPARRAELSRELADLSGGSDRLAARARELLAAGEHRLAGHFAQLAADAAPDDETAHTARAEVFTALEKAATSTMAKGVYAWAAAESQAALDGTDRAEQLRTRTAGRTRWAF
ncbi:alkyl sulfatase dimerization domain-containing protein [Amycolatopsis dendrobii]|uniref:MBL fold metallo-hydrolase n=1 Tax=Amycolatopsis dendrobii TaxID=2760662 RepID=A0A7W3VR81_9PSEU|nr:alkyl sulfatase dimerization domain-containing protein [Amycolatopsis dendrobii]MBB1151713.1 MBL fold metallo-hydrolase [Amycolatopsis dendrobii]